MLKNKFKIITLFLTILLTISIPIVRAENETVSSNDIMLINNTDSEDPEANDHQQITTTDTANTENTNNEETTNSEETTTENATENPEAISSEQASSEDSFKKSDIYLIGDNITIDYIIDGNLFVMANSVTINSQIGGDAFIMANSITVGEQGYVFSNLFAMSDNLDIKGVVYDVYALSKKTNLSGYIYRDLRISSNDLSIPGVVGRNAFVNCSNLTFTQANESENSESEITSNGSINGNLDYSAPNEISIPEGAVSGETNYTKEITSDKDSFNLQDAIVSLVALIATVVIIWLVCLWLAPKFLDNTVQLITKKTLPVIAYGILTPIVIVIASIIALILGITAKIGLLALMVLFLLIGIGSPIFIITINNIICNKLKIEKTTKTFGMLILSSVVLWLIDLIPYVGSIVGLIAGIIGLGIVTMSLLKKDKIKETDKNKDSK